MRRTALGALVALLAAASPLFGNGEPPPHPPGTSGLVTIVHGHTLSDLIRNLYGGDGITLDDSVGHQAHFGQTLDFQQFSDLLQRTLQSRSFAPIPSAVGLFSYRFNEETGTYERIDSTLGPILGERATTAGKGTFNIAVAYNVADFQRVDGREEIEVTLRHCTEFACTGGNPDLPLFKDVIQVDVRMRLKSQTLTTFLVYGLRNNLDIGLLLPFVRNDLTIFSHARVITAPGSVPGVHVFDPLTESPGQFGTAHAMGIGDMILRAKYGLTRLPFDAAILADVTVPTGNKANFLGTGAFRARGVFIASATGERFSPHLNLGMEVNAENENLSSIEYRLGSEWAISPRVTLVGDLLGTVRPFLGDEFEARAVETQSLVGRSEIDFALGAKYKIRDNAVLLFNYLVPMNDAGIRPETSFTFGVQMAVK